MNFSLVAELLTAGSNVEPTIQSFKIKKGFELLI